MESTFTDRFPVRIYWEDTDAGGIVYHANYLKYMERARSELLARLEVSQQDERQRPDGVLFVVVAVDLRYHRRDHRLQASARLPGIRTEHFPR